MWRVAGVAADRQRGQGNRCLRRPGCVYYVLVFVCSQPLTASIAPFDCASAHWMDLLMLHKVVTIVECLLNVVTFLLPK